MARFILFILLECMLRLSYGQNLVPNNGFETNDAMPTGYGQWYHCTGWSDVNNYPAFLWPYASPDYLHNTGGVGVDLPVSTFGTVSPFAGSAIMGFITWLGSTPEFREYLSVPLICPMVPGTTYTVGFWITNGSATWYNGYSSNHIGVHLSTGPLTQATHEPINVVPQLEYAGELWSTSWQYVSFTYTADDSYSYITIGNFYNDASTAHSFHVASVSIGSYYFIDEVAVIPETPLPITLLAFEATPDEGHVDLDWITESEQDMDHYVLNRSTDGMNYTELGIIDACGDCPASSVYAFVDDAPVSGWLYYQLIPVDVTGGTEAVEPVAVYYEGTDFKPLCYPNPAHTGFSIPAMTGIVRIYQINGQLMTELHMTGEAQYVDCAQWSTGSYVVQFIYDDDVYNGIQIIE